MSNLIHWFFSFCFIFYIFDFDVLPHWRTLITECLVTWQEFISLWIPAQKGNRNITTCLQNYTLPTIFVSKTQTFIEEECMYVTFLNESKNQKKKFFLIFWFLIFLFLVFYFLFFYSFIAKLSQAKPQHQLSWLALASLNFT